MLTDELLKEIRSVHTESLRSRESLSVEQLIIMINQACYHRGLLLCEVERLQYNNGRMTCEINDMRGSLAHDTCSMCNWLERGDCYVEKERLRAEVEKLRKLLKSHPCLTDDGELDHSWKSVNDSFDHEFGTEVIIYDRCENCNAQRDSVEGEEDDPQNPD